jgi:hypothetical protein
MPLYFSVVFLLFKTYLLTKVQAVQRKAKLQTVYKKINKALPAATL